MGAVITEDHNFMVNSEEIAGTTRVSPFIGVESYKLMSLYEVSSVYIFKYERETR
jgi:hypothetical protein